MAAEIGDTPSAAQRGLILSATASFAALHIVREKLLAARRFKRIETLIEQLTPLQGALARTLRALGLASGDADAGDGMDRDELSQITAEIAARHENNPA